MPLVLLFWVYSILTKDIYKQLGEGQSDPCKKLYEGKIIVSGGRIRRQGVFRLFVSKKFNF